MADKEVRIKITTEADATAAKVLNQEIVKTGDAVKSVEQATIKITDYRDRERISTEAATKAFKEWQEERRKARQGATYGLATDSADVHDYISGKGTKPADDAKALARGLNEVSNAAPRAERGTRNMGMAALEFSRAVEDAQYGIRGVLNNIPGLVMMLGGTAGIAGAASLAAVAIAQLAPRLKELFGSADETKALEEYKELLTQVAERTRKIGEERGSAAMKEWLDSLDDEEQAIRDQNEALQDNIDLLRTRREVQMEVDAADRENRKAQVDLDSTLTEEEKIRKKAAIEEEASRAQAQSRIDSQKDNVTSARKTAGEARGLADREAQDLARVEESRALKERERLRADQMYRDSLNAEKAMPNAEATLSEASKRLSLAVSRESSQTNSVEDLKKAKEETSRARAAEESAKAEIAKLRALSDELPKRSDALGEATKAVEKADADLQARRSRVETLQIDAADAERKAAVTYEDAKLRVEGIKESYSTERDTRNRRTENAAETARGDSLTQARDLLASLPEGGNPGIRTALEESIRGGRITAAQLKGYRGLIEDESKAARERERNEAAVGKMNSEGQSVADRAEKMANDVRLTPAQRKLVTDRAAALRKGGVQEGETAALGQLLDRILKIVEQQSGKRSDEAIDVQGLIRRVAKLEQESKKHGGQIKNSRIYTR